MSKPDLKELCRIFYMTKGHLNVNIKTVEQCYDGYFKRLWNNNEGYLKEEGFDKSYKQFIRRQELDLGTLASNAYFNKIKFKI
tara:strand:+ start:10053 stop:10301 length:249 start_codon:yes stop_codon:yes gene_type:complete